ncbi:helix-turn-helix domain-containing protein [Sphingomonas sp. 32-62-10]
MKRPPIATWSSPMSAITMILVCGAQDMHDIGKRLLIAMKARGIPKQYLLADLISVDQSAVTRWISGKSMSISHAIAICNQLNLSMDWLILGIGEMYRENLNSAEDKVHSVEALSEEAKYIIIKTIDYMTSIEGARSNIAFSAI